MIYVNLSPAEQEVVDMIQFLHDEDMKVLEHGGPHTNDYFMKQNVLRTVLKTGALVIRDQEIVPEFDVKTWLRNEEGQLIFA